MSKFLEHKVIPNSPDKTSANRYQILGLKDAEPNLGVPPEDNFVLASDTSGNRQWISTNFDNIPNSIINHKGDLIVGEADNTPVVLSVGLNGEVLMADSSECTGVKWASVSSTAGIPSGLLNAKGDIIVAVSNDNPGVLPVGSNGEVLTANSSAANGLGVEWQTPTSGVNFSFLNAKGDLIIAAGNDDPERLEVGDTGQVLTVNPSAPLGVEWATPSISGGSAQFTAIGVGVAPAEGWEITTQGGIIQKREIISASANVYTIDMRAGNEFTTGVAVSGGVTFNLNGSSLAQLPSGFLWRGVLTFLYTSGTIAWFPGNAGWSVKWDGNLALSPTPNEVEKVVIEVWGGSNTIEVAPLRGRY